MTEAIIKEATSIGIWALLFVALLYYTINNSEKREQYQLEEIQRAREESVERENRQIEKIRKIQEESRQREERLMEHLDKTNASHYQIAKSMEKIEKRVVEGFTDIWETLEKVRNKEE